MLRRTIEKTTENGLSREAGRGRSTKRLGRNLFFTDIDKIKEMMLSELK